jgi:hypothetical protein
MEVESHARMILTGKLKNSEEKPVPVPLIHHKFHMD